MNKMAKDTKRYVIGVDTGGTFTDIVVLSDSGEIVTAKAPTTPHDWPIGVMNAIAEAAKSMKISRKSLLEQCFMLKHGTTVATNAVITGTGSKVGFITTKGFEDTTLIGRAIQKVDGLTEEDTVKMPYITKPEPLVPKSRLKGVYERIDFAGNVVVPLNLDDARLQIRSLVEDEKVDAISVSLLFSWVNPIHEKGIKELITSMYPDDDLFLTFSHELVPMVREYGRANTVIVNSFVGRVMARYLSSLRERLEQEGFTGSLMAMQSNGGIVSWDRVTPIRTLSSGPAGGIIASQFMANLLGLGNVISTDSGGTSFDVSVIRDGFWSYEREPIIGRWRLMLPMIKVDSIGGGGGTIAHADPDTHRLIVGPRSAGASPGPACYNAGGTEATVVDADLILGFLDPDYFLGGRIKLNKALAEEVIREKVADPLRMDLVEAAAGIHTVINVQMADLIRRQIMRSGLLPEDFVLFAFGGTSGMHVAGYGAELGVKKAYIFPTSEVFSAFGIAGSDVIQTYSGSLGYRMPIAANVLHSRMTDIERKLAEEMGSEGFSRKSLEFRRTFHMRYRRQVNYLGITVPRKKYGSDADVIELTEAWKEKFDEVYGKGSAYPKAGIELVSVDIDAIGKVVKPLVKRYPDAGPNSSAAIKGYRPILFPGITADFIRTAIYGYDKLRSGNVIEGPAVVESPTNTVVIPPEKVVRVDQFLNLVLEL
jgi:N-methylhydantoinase A